MRYLRIITVFAIATSAALASLADYAVTEATSSSQTFALYTSAAATLASASGTRTAIVTVIGGLMIIIQ